MECRGCGNANREGARFCEACGSPLAATCGACGTPASPGARVIGPMSTNFKLALETRVDVAVAAGETDALKSLLDEVDALPPGHRTAWLRAIRARMAAHLGESGEFEVAEAILRELDLRFRLAVVLLESFEKNGDEARRAEARDLFEELGAVAWLDRIPSPGLVTAS